MQSNGSSLSRWTTIVALSCCVLMTATVIRREFFRPRTPARLAAEDVKPVQLAQWDDLKSVGHALGPSSAPVTIVVFSDFECPFCKRFASGTMPGIRRQYPQEVRFLFRHWPIRNHRFAYPAARATECAARQGAFEAYHDAIFAKQDSLGLKPFQEFAREAGVKDLGAFEKCYAKPGPVREIEDDLEAAIGSGGSGTPTVIINGWRFKGALDSATVDSVVRSHLSATRAKPTPS